MLSIEQLEEIQVWLLALETASPALRKRNDDAAEAIGELIARRRVEEARMRAFLDHPDGPQAG